ncbi:MAG: hypothetical protein M1820_001539 [Bogoriella megaspora]|nr:MAG: hypothetical protein M1820_001539 [Bogoriella megaspora]
MASGTPQRGLVEQLAELLPKDVEVDLHHISTPPTRCGAIFSPPPGGKPERTYRETQFLLVSINVTDSNGILSKVFIFAIEIYIYTTNNLTTIFVSKADSTGYITKLKLPKGTPSPLKSVSSVFISWLVENRRRPGVKLVVSLFARAQDQYLFPGSIENPSKHVLDDRGLVKWWCRVLDSNLEAARESTVRSGDEVKDLINKDDTPQGYLIVPGFDRYETVSFFPPSYKTQPSDQKTWHSGHPLNQIAPEPNAPPRCLVPHFPDDPKSRFLDELDEELPEVSGSQVEISPSKRGSGQWRSVKTLDQFWEMMTFRQECSSGRLVGFIWILFDTVGELEGQNGLQYLIDDDIGSSQSSIPSALPRRPSGSERRRPQRLTGIINPRLPRIKSSSSGSRSESSAFFVWPSESRGEIVLDDKGYDRAHDLLLKLDFAGVEVANLSTLKWVEEVGAIAGRSGIWAKNVTGKLISAPVLDPSTHGNTSSAHSASGTGTVNVLNTTMIKKKRKPTEMENSSTDSTGQVEPNALPMSSIRKKPKPG